MAMQVTFPFGKFVSVFVSHVDESTGNFFVQISDEAGKLETLMSEIDQAVQAGSAVPLRSDEIMVGAIYLVQYQADGVWYRARLLGVNSASQECEVFFIDYGNTDHVPVSCMRVPKEKFCKLPAQSFECELEGLDRLKGDCSWQETVTLLNDTILEQELYCRAVHLRKNCVLVAQLFTDDSGRDSVFNKLSSSLGLRTAPEVDLLAIDKGQASLPREPNLKREVKYEHVRLTADSFYDLMVTWVEDPSNFWCQQMIKGITIANLMESIAAVYADLGPEVLPLRSCTVGYPCCAKYYEDESWYRGIITNVSSIAAGQIEVRFVDFGNSQKTELSDVRDLKDEFLKVPCQAIHFAIAGVDPDSKDGLWADEAKALFDKLINNKHVVGLVVNVEADGRHKVKLIDTTTDLDMELNQVLIAAGYGVKSREVNSPTTHPAVIKSSDSSPKAPPPSIFARERVQIGKEEKVLVTNVINPSKFYCELFRNAAKLENLMQEIARHYSKLGTNEEVLSLLSPGDPCCAQFSEDSCWYRAIVLDTSPKGVTVLYVDYGNSETLPAGKIKKLIPRFSDLPQQAIECSLNRIKPNFNGGELKWRVRDINVFQELALEKEAMMTVIAEDQDGVKRVELIIRNKREDQNVSDQLLVGGNATLADGALPTTANWKNVLSQTLSSPDLNVGHFEDVMVSYTEHPGNFWCQLLKTGDELASLMDKIMSHYIEIGQKDVISNPACGMLCCAQYTEDDAWYRGKITGLKKGGLVEVHFVDYGNYEILPLSRVKMLKADFMKLPVQAVHCDLAKFHDLCDDSLLSDDVMTRFEELTTEKELVMMADKYNQSNDTYSVDLVDTSEGKNLDIAVELQSIIGPMKNREAAKIPCLDLQPGITEHVFVSSVDSVSKFFCQLMNNAESLDELMGEMAEFYGNLIDQQDCLSKPLAGEFCAAKFTLDDTWYRAKITSVQSNQVSVCYIDYGNTETIPLSRIKVLNPKFQNLPIQALECSFSRTSGSVVGDEFQELVSEKEFNAHVISVKSGTAEVDLISMETQVSIRDVLGMGSGQAVEPEQAPCKVASMQWKTGECVDVFIPFSESAQKFFCQATKHSSELDELMNRMEKHYSASQESLSFVAPGSFCVAWYEEGGWYRAKVDRVTGAEVDVFYIDYGDTATVPLTKLRTLEEAFSLLPAQAVQCCLKGFATSQGPPSFSEVAVEQECKAQVINIHNKVFEVELVSDTGAVSQMLGRDTISTSVPICDVPTVQWNYGDKVQVFVPYVESAQKFFCQASEQSSELDDLMNRLEEHYSATRETAMSISVGAFCVALYVEGGWYRARVNQVQGNTVEVFYIDYGDIATLPLSNIRTLKPEFSSFPAQAIQCCLKGFSANQGPPEFKELVCEKEFEAQVVSIKDSSIYEVDLVLKDNSTVISQLLSEEEQAGKSTGSVPTAGISRGMFVDLCPTACVNPNLFYCHIVTAERKNSLEQLMSQLQVYYGNLQEHEASITDPRIGMQCAAVFADDGLWYRGKITKVLNQKTIEVFYVDYGNHDTVPLNKVKILKDDWRSLPGEAIECTLPQISPMNGTEWPNITVERFTNLTVHKQLVGKISKLGNDNGLELELFDTSNNSVDVNIGDLLVQEGLAIHATSKHHPTGTVPLLGSLIDLGTLKVSSKEKVFVTAVDSPQCFYCQISGSESKLTTLMEQMSAEYDGLSQGDFSVGSISVGNVCCAQFSEDNMWYRATVEALTGDSLRVRFIDYGNTETMPISKIKLLKDSFLCEPPFAIQCCLHGITPVEGQVLTDEAAVMLEELTADKELDATFSSTSPPYKAQLFDCGTDIAEELVKARLAVSTVAATKSVNSTKETAVGYSPSSVKCGEIYDVYISHISSAGQFYCQLVKMSDKLDGMMNDLNAHYFELGETEGCIVSPVVGQPCVALYEGMWHRATVQDVSVNSVTVFYVDYGNKEALKVSGVKQITPAFLKTPVVAIECSLDLSRDEWPEDTTALLEELSGSEIRTVKVVSNQRNRYEVKVFGDSVHCISDEVLSTVKETGEEQVKKEKAALKEPNMQPGQVEKLYVAHVESTEDFYVQLSKSYTELEEMMDEIAEVYSGLSDDVRPEDLVVGATCCALFADDSRWYRAVIKRIASDNEVEVQYVDYGNSAVVPLSDVRELSGRFFSLPVQAICCGLDSAADFTFEAFEQQVVDKELEARFLSMDSKKWRVALFNDSKKIEGDTSSIKKAAVVVEDAEGIFEIREYVQHTIDPGLKARLYISHVVSPDEFYVQFESMLDDLSALSQELSTFYSELPPFSDILCDPCPGMSCCAKFSEDGEWYRGKVTQVDQAGAIVQFVDYGNDDHVLFKDVKEIDKSFVRLPQQAILCGLEATKDVWAPEEVALFTSITMDKSFDATFIICDGKIWRVSLEMDSGSVLDLFLSNDNVEMQHPGSDISGVQTSNYLPAEVTADMVEEGYVCHITESGDFFVQLSRTEPALTALQNLLHELYEGPGSSDDITMKDCFVDSLCCARFNQDNHWYRARVTKVISDAAVQVIFVDYGNTETLNVRSIKQLKPQPLEYPLQAIKCRLEGSKDVLTASDVEEFEACVLDKPLHVTFTRQVGTTWFVTIKELDIFQASPPMECKRFVKESLQVNKPEEAYFLSADSSECIWLHLVRNEDALNQVMDQIAAELSDESLTESQVVKGLACVGCFTEDDRWYRAQVLDVDCGVNVMYVDYGNSEVLPFERLRSISDSATMLPAQAICCKLSGMQGVDPSKVTSFLNDLLCEKVLEVEAQSQQDDGSFVVMLFIPGNSHSVNEQIVGECLGDTSLSQEVELEQASPLAKGTAQEKTFKLPELQQGSKVSVNLVSVFLPTKMKLSLTERTEELYQTTSNITSVYSSLNEDMLKVEDPSVGQVCCGPFTREGSKSEEWFRGELISVSADGTADVKLVDYGSCEKIPLSRLRMLKDEFLETPVHILECSLAGICPSSEDGQWSVECSSVIESFCKSKALTAEIQLLAEDTFELILYDDSGKSVSQALVDSGLAKTVESGRDFFEEEQSLVWPKLEVGNSLDVYFLAAEKLESLQLQLVDSETELTEIMEKISAVYSTLTKEDLVLGNPRVGLPCCAQYSKDNGWYRALITSVTGEGVEVKFIDYGNIDLALAVKELSREFFLLPVQCVECKLKDVITAPGTRDEDIVSKLATLCESKVLTAEVMQVSGDSVEVDLFYDDESGSRTSVAATLIDLGLGVAPLPLPEEPRHVSISESGKMVYNYPKLEAGCQYDVTVISAKSPNNFWCYLTETMSELEFLSQKIGQFYDLLGENDLRVLCLQVGDTCCAKFSEDGKWYRSQVIELGSGSKVCVLSVDYGKQETLAIDRIKKLDVEFATLPVQVLRCTLCNLEPPHKYYEQDWSEDTLARFQELCTKVPLTVKIVEVRNDLVSVALFDSDHQPISDRLVSEGFAVEVSPVLETLPVKDSCSQPSDEVELKQTETDVIVSEDTVCNDSEIPVDNAEQLQVNVEEYNIQVTGEDDNDSDEFQDSNDKLESESLDPKQQFRKDSEAVQENEQSTVAERLDIEDVKTETAEQLDEDTLPVQEKLEPLPTEHFATESKEGIHLEETQAETQGQSAIEPLSTELDEPSEQTEEEKGSEKGSEDVPLEREEEEKGEVSDRASLESKLEGEKVESVTVVTEKEGRGKGQESIESETTIAEDDLLKEGQQKESASEGNDTEEKDDAEEMDDEFVEAQEEVVDGLSEEVLTAISGTANGADVDEKSEEERYPTDLGDSNNVDQEVSHDELAQTFLDEIINAVVEDLERKKEHCNETILSYDSAVGDSDANVMEDNELSDDALEKLDHEIEVEDSDSMKCPTQTQFDASEGNVVVNGTRVPESSEVVENGQNSSEQADIFSCL